jgi:fibronectin type 3 domain-containing protein
VKIPLSGLGVQASAQSVSLNWSASTSSGIIGYDVYRGTVSGGPYNLLTSSPDASTEYTDSSVLAGNTYYYVVTSVNSSNVQSSYSSQVAAAIPAQ